MIRSSCHLDQFAGRVVWRGVTNQLVGHDYQYDLSKHLSQTVCLFV